jgi:hypothetical protein
MSDNKEFEEDDLNEFSLIEENPENIQTDVVMEMKIGIYNLFIGLYNHLMVEYGPIEAIKQSTDFLEEIVINFRSALEK